LEIGLASAIAALPFIPCGCQQDSVQ
jgi:hypothetical protein